MLCFHMRLSFCPHLEGGVTGQKGVSGQRGGGLVGDGWGAGFSYFSLFVRDGEFTIVHHL